MKKRRIFIAINLREDIKKKLVEFQRQWHEFPLRLTKKNSLHLTLLFIGYATDEEMLKICQVAKEIAKKHNSFVLHFNQICLGPPRKLPRLIWLEGERNEMLFNLKIGLENAIMSGEAGSAIFHGARKTAELFYSAYNLSANQANRVEKIGKEARNKPKN